MTAVRSALFLFGAFLLTVPFGLLVASAGLLGYRSACRMAQLYCVCMLKWVEWTCGIRYEVEGWEHVPGFPVIVMAKHQSAWETLFMEASFPPLCWIVKRELLWLPFVGWGLMAVRCIAIDRSSGHAARDQILEQGARRMAQGMWVSIFPEGTRIAPGKRGRYGIGGAYLATRTGTPILPLAHNAGEFWGRYAFRKHAGTVKVVIGPLIETRGRDVTAVNSEVEQWIETQMRRISPHRYAAA
jgi:1-acyl-sn-glycerol-3-phosphate acyltransferase